MVSANAANVDIGGKKEDMASENVRKVQVKENKVNKASGDVTKVEVGIEEDKVKVASEDVTKVEVGQEENKVKVASEDVTKVEVGLEENKVKVASEDVTKQVKVEQEYVIKEITCIDHNDSKVTLFCQSCQQLICTKCISQDSSSVCSKHHDHVYLDVVEAYKMHKEDMVTLLARFEDNMKNKRTNLRELQNAVQTIRFEVLRKQAKFSKKFRSLNVYVAKESKQFLSNIHKFIEPWQTELERALDSVISNLKSDVDVLTEARLPPSQCITFLQNLGDIKNKMTSVINNTERLMVDGAMLEADLRRLRNINVTLQRDKKLVKQTFAVPKSKPSAVKPLWNWCIVGATSACLTWKCQQTTNPDSFYIYYKPYLSSDTDSRQNWKMVKIRNTVTGRVHAILHKLKPETVYTVKICAVNYFGKSAFREFYIYTHSARLSQSVQQIPQSHKDAIYFNVFVFLAILLYVCILMAIFLYAFGDFFEFACDIVKENCNNRYVGQLVKYTMCGVSDVVKTVVKHVEDSVCDHTNFPAVIWS